MIKMSSSKCAELLVLFLSIRNILFDEGDLNWLPGIDNIINFLTPPNYGNLNDPEKAFNEVAYLYRAMEAGNGSFSDYYIWRDDFEERKKINQELGDIKNKIWNKLDKNIVYN